MANTEDYGHPGDATSVQGPSGQGEPEGTVAAQDPTQGETLGAPGEGPTPDGFSGATPSKDTPPSGASGPAVDQGAAEAPLDIGQGEEYCLLESEDFVFNVGVVGTGSGFLSILDLASHTDYAEQLPPMHLVAVAEPGENESKLICLRKLNVPTYATWEGMLARHPEINLIIELSGGKFRLAHIRGRVPSHVSVVDHDTAIFFCAMHNMIQITSHCRADLRHHRMLMEAVMDEVREDVMLLDAKCRVVDMNKNVYTRRGASKNELVGKNCWEVATLSDGEPFCQEMDERCPVTATLNTWAKAEALMTRVSADGHLHYYRVYSYPVFDSHGKLSHVLLMRRDITARTLREKMQQEREKLAVLGEMSMYLAHEIRNPIFAIGGFTKALLQAPELSAKSMEKIKIIGEETRRLETILSSILKFTRPTQSMLFDLELNPLVEESLELVRIGYGGLGFEITASLAPNLPKVRGDGEVLKQTVLTLVKNAMEAMDRPGEIRVATGLANEFVFLSVEDEGRGMSRREIEKAFSPFGTVKGGENYGLGLALIKKSIEEFGGSIDLRSREGLGTKVTLYLPPILGRTSEDRGIVSY